MEKLIDKNAALESVCHNCCCDPEECKRDDSYCTDYMSILNLPTIEVKHGRWVQKEFWPNGGTWKCSECGYQVMFIEDTPYAKAMNYCPNCGAKMDLEEE